ncbi:MAG: 6-hydroxycyclohex-1-ene-1-carbonyl-CoA dehydrogenase [Fidelibacterota bacterium]
MNRIPEIKAYQMTGKDRPLDLVSFPIPEINPGHALVKVAGCGVCHTDLSFWHYGVPTRHELPLVLGHEISGYVVEGPDELKGQPVVVPAVLPCGECELCRQGRSNICQRQQMPGNDFHGGFASHVVVPVQFLIPLSDSLLADHSLEELAVVADAVSTPYQAIVKSGLQKDEFAIIIGVGGIGLYAVQIARHFKGKVLAVDIDQDKLDRLKQFPGVKTLNIKGLDIKTIKSRIKALAKEGAVSRYNWKIFEMSGTKPGQELGYALLNIAGTLSIVGFTLEKLELRLSNLMAFDAQVIGTWGCKPELYPQVLKLIEDRQLELTTFTDIRPLSQINTVFQQLLKHQLQRRPVLVPDF